MENWKRNRASKILCWWPFAALLLSIQVMAQHDPYADPIWRLRQMNEFDSSSIGYAFKNGTMHGHFRQFSMATINTGDFPDYYAIATGGGLRYQTAGYHHFRLTVSGHFIQNLSSSNLAKADLATGVMNRYEIGLYDLTNPTATRGLARLEELHLSYSRNQWMVTLGNQIINTPFINPQDGRMRPTEVAGLWTRYQRNNKRLLLEGGWLYHMAPRSTLKWYGISESIGLYSQGIATNGKPAAYRNALPASSVLYGAGTFSLSKNVSGQVVNQWVKGLFNTAMVQANWQQPLGKKHKLIANAQYTRQDAIGNGGNDDPVKSYFNRGEQSNVLSTRLGWAYEQWQVSGNYTRIFSGGRFLMPREWGREPFFTFMQRERNEGLGNVQAGLLKITRRIPQFFSTVDVGIGLYNLPDILDFANNKYGLPSYGQANLLLNHRFNNALKGLEAEFLYTYKWNRGNTHNKPNAVINKVNMSNINLVFNYFF